MSLFITKKSLLSSIIKDSFSLMILFVGINLCLLEIIYHLFWRILFILKEEHYITDFIVINHPLKKELRIFLKYDRDGGPVIRNITRESKPGRRVYVGASEIPRILDGLGVAILTTSKGVISNKVAKKLKIGGELLCSVW